jgi:hypothetical protein
MEDVTPGVVNIATRGHVEIEQTPFFAHPGFREFFENPSLRRFFSLPEESMPKMDTSSPTTTSSHRPTISWLL